MVRRAVIRACLDGGDEEYRPYDGDGPRPRWSCFEEAFLGYVGKDAHVCLDDGWTEGDRRERGARLLKLAIVFGGHLAKRNDIRGWAPLAEFGHIIRQISSVLLLAGVLGFRQMSLYRLARATCDSLVTHSGAEVARSGSDSDLLLLDPVAAGEHLLRFV